MNILFIGDIFGLPGVVTVEKALPKLIKRYAIDFVIAQGENITNRKGLVKEDYLRLKRAGVNAFTMGNHVWSEPEIMDIIGNKDIIRPYNINSAYPGRGTNVFKIGSETLRVTSMLGIEYNELRSGWGEKSAENFFDAFDNLVKSETTSTYHIIDFHGEVTSEKAVFGLYLDGKVTAFVGTHTHVQTSDARNLPQGTLFITDVGMTGPMNAAIGADYDSVYQRMRFNNKSKFTVSTNRVQINAVVLQLKNGADLSKNRVKALNIRKIERI